MMSSSPPHVQNSAASVISIAISVVATKATSGRSSPNPLSIYWGKTPRKRSMNFLKMKPPNLAEAREALDCVVAEVDRAGDIIHRIKDHVKKAPPKMEGFDINEAIRNAIILTRGEVVKIGASIQTQLAKPLPFLRGDRVQIQQVMVNLIVNAVQAMSGDGHSRRELQINTETDEAEGVRV